MAKYLDSTGVSTLWSKIKGSFLSLGGGTVNGDVTIGSKSKYYQRGTRGAVHHELVGDDADYGVVKIRHTASEGSGSPGSYTATLAVIDERPDTISGTYEPTFFINRSGATRVPDLMGINVGGSRCFTVSSNKKLTFTGGGNGDVNTSWIAKFVQGTDCGSGNYDTVIISSGDVCSLRISESDGTQLGLCGGDHHSTFTSTNDFRFYTGTPANAPIYSGGGGTLKLALNYSNYAVYANGTIYSTSTITSASGFVLSGSSSSYVLLGDGTTKAISDFATSGHTHNYLSLAGGTLTANANPILILNNTGTQGEVGIRFNRSGTQKGWVGYHDSLGMYIYNAARSKYLNYKDDGTLQFEGNTVIHSGNYSTYCAAASHTHSYLPLSGGTISNTSGLNLILNNTTSSQVGISLRNEGTQKAIVGWEPGTYGVYLQNTTISSAPYVNLASDGTFKYCNSQTFWHSGNDGAGSGLDADTLDGYEYATLVPKKHNNYFYPYINTEYSSCWYKVTLPFTGHQSSGNSWLMVKMEISLGGTYSSGAGGRIFLSYYFYKTAGEEGPWAAHNVYGIAIGWKLSSNSVKIMYDLSDPAVFYLHAGDSNYNTISIDNLSANDTAAGYDFSTTTISRIAASSIPETANKIVPISFVETTNGTNLLINNHAVWTDENFTPGNYLPLTGGTLSGALRFSQNVGGHVSVDSSGIYIQTGQHWIRVSNSGGADYDGYTIYHSGNLPAYPTLSSLGAAAVGHNHDSTYLKLSGGTITGTTASLLTIKSSNNDNYITFKQGDTVKGYIGWENSTGMFMQNGNKYIHVSDAGDLKFYDSSSDRTIYHSGNLTPSDYVTKANPGTLTSTGNATITLNGLDNTSETGIVLNRKGTTKAWIGYHDSNGAYIYNSARGKYLNYKDDGSLLFEGNTVYHSGNLTLSTLGGAATGHTHSDYLYTSQVTQTQTNVTWVKEYGATKPKSFVYNTSGVEWSYLFGLRSDEKYGMILKMGYTDTYLRMLRVNSGTWQSEDWEKISAGYADSAGNASTVGGYAYNNLPYVPKLAWHSENSGESVNDLACGTGFYYITHGCPTSGTVASFSGTNNSYQLQIQGKYFGKEFWYRSKNSDNGTWNAWTQVIDTNNIGSQTVSNSYALSGYGHAAFIKKRESGWNYNNLAATYSGGTNPVYWRVTIPKPDVWCMIQMTFSLIQKYDSGYNAKIVVYGNCWGTSEWTNFNSVVYGVSNDSIKVYGSEKKYIYIYTNNAWETLSLDKVICSDGITGQDISGVTIDWVASLPETYQTASTYYGIHTGNALNNSEIDTIMS